MKRITLLDDDRVDVTNLHRQTLYSDADLGRDKAEAAAESLRRDAHPGLEIVARRGRLLPSTAEALLADTDLVVEGADNFATKFLAADAGRVHAVPVAHAGAVRWNGWAMLSPAEASEGPCLRCIFEDIPRDRVETCATAGVIGPVVGVLAAFEAALALAWLGGDRGAAGTLFHYDGLAGRARRAQVASRPGCPLCEGEIQDLRADRYQAACDAA